MTLCKQKLFKKIFVLIIEFIDRRTRKYFLLNHCYSEQKILKFHKLNVIWTVTKTQNQN